MHELWYWRLSIESQCIKIISGTRMNLSLSRVYKRVYKPLVYRWHMHESK